MDFKSFVYEAVKKQELENRLRSLVSENGILLFFEFDKEVFGCGEDGRVMFARIKSPNPGEVKAFADEASFVAVNLSRLAKGEVTKSLFKKKDMNKIKVVSEDEAVQKLVKSGGSAESVPVGTGDGDPKPDNFIYAMEKK